MLAFLIRRGSNWGSYNDGVQVYEFIVLFRQVDQLFGIEFIGVNKIRSEVEFVQKQIWLGGYEERFGGLEN